MKKIAELESEIHKLKQFGVVRFENAKPQTGRPMQISYLNEPQALLLLTYTRSRPATDNLRHKLIKDFMSMRRAFSRLIPKTAIPIGISHDPPL